MLKFFTTLEKKKIDSIAIGGFDGMHRAHQALVDKLTPHGALLIIHRGGIGLTPKTSRARYHDKASIMIELSQIKEMSAEAFVDFLHQEFPALKKIVVGYDFRFANERKGDVALLKSLFKGEVEVVEEIFYQGISVHAKHIKELLQEADILQANALLGRVYNIKAKVITGQGIGKEKLYATLNLDSGDFFLPKEGVYASKVKIGEKAYPSVCFIGKRLSTDGAFSVETHILDEDFSEELAEVELLFIDFIRENRKFDDLGDLKAQITQDIQKAKLILAQPLPLF